MTECRTIFFLDVTANMEVSSSTKQNLYPGWVSIPNSVSFVSSHTEIVQLIYLNPIQTMQIQNTVKINKVNT